MPSCQAPWYLGNLAPSPLASWLCQEPSPWPPWHPWRREISEMRHVHHLVHEYYLSIYECCMRSAKFEEPLSESSMYTMLLLYKLQEAEELSY